MIYKHLLSLLLALVATSMAAPSFAGPATDPITVAPGSVVRWQGEGVQTCHLDDRSWGARNGDCLVPVDLLRTGTFEAMRTYKDGRYEKLSLRVGDYPYKVQRLTVADRHVNLSEEDQKRANAESGRINQLWPSEREPAFELPLLPPLAKLPAGGRFGARRIINGEPRNPHTGRDYSAGRGTAVKATAGGEVVLAEHHFFAGKSVFIDHGDGLISMYFHLDSIEVEKGQRVEGAQTIGKVGSTGRSTGPHLHFGLRWHGARVDPTPLLASPAELKRVP